MAALIAVEAMRVLVGLSARLVCVHIGLFNFNNVSHRMKGMEAYELHAELGALGADHHANAKHGHAREDH